MNRLLAQLYLGILRHHNSVNEFSRRLFCQYGDWGTAADADSLLRWPPRHRRDRYQLTAVTCKGSRGNKGHPQICYLLTTSGHQLPLGGL